MTNDNSTNLTQHSYNDSAVYQDAGNNYVDVTALCQSEGKHLKHYLANKGSKAYLEALSVEVGIPTSQLISEDYGNQVGLPQHTFAHPQAAMDIAQWVSINCRIWANKTLVQVVTYSAAKPKTALQLAREQVELLEELEVKEQELQIQKAITADLEEDNERQAEIIDELYGYSSIIRVAKFNGCSEKAFSWRQLKAASKTLNIEIKTAPCPRFERKNLYSHDAWRLAYPEYKLPETTTLVIKR